MRIDQQRADQVREAVRTALAKAMAGTARGLAVASRAAESTARQLRPPESRVPRSHRHSPPASAPVEPSPVAAPADADGERATSAASAGDSDGSGDVSALTDLNARDLIAHVPGLGRSDLTRLRALEADGKARKTVLAAIDRALEA